MPLSTHTHEEKADEAEWSLRVLQRKVEALAQKGLRVLALASREVPSGTFDTDTARKDVERNLTLVGLVGMYDPPRPETKGAVQLCHTAGITVR